MMDRRRRAEDKLKCEGNRLRTDGLVRYWKTVRRKKKADKKFK
jgi:hypothetical protein